MVDAKFFSKEWIYNNIFNISNDEQEEIRNSFVDDAKEFYRLEAIQNEGTDPADPNASDESGEEENSWGFGKFDEMTDEEKARVKEREKEEKKRKNADKEYDHPDDKPMGRDPLGRDERKVSGRSWSESPLKLEADLQKLDQFLNNSPTKNDNKKKQIISESNEMTDLKKELNDIVNDSDSKVEDSK